MNKLHEQFGGRLGFRDAIKTLGLEHRELVVRVRKPTARGVATPVIEVSPSIEFTYPNGRIQKLSRAKLFTATTKMRCGSFSLPAGPPAIGGTCPASVQPKDADPKTWVCSGCYATSSNYGYPSVQTVQALRKEWVRRMLHVGQFADAMSWALAQYFASPRHATIPLPGDRKARVEMDRRFFRIHDAGDFSWAGDAYIIAWGEIARRFPEVRFWAPTRDWVFNARLPALREAMRMAPNLAIRPSALEVDALPPNIPGLAAGTSVAFDGGSSRRVWNCPAYAAEEHSCATGINPHGKPGCRVCWVMPKTTVNYNPHGTITDKPLVQLRLRKNPEPYRPDLASMYRDFQRSTRSKVRKNPTPHAEARVSFVAWLAEQGAPASTFGEVAWIEMLGKLGVKSFDDRVSYLEDTAEWG